MLSRRSAPCSRGFTLVELLVAMIVAGIVLTLITLTGLRQQRLLSDLANDASLAAQLREAAAILPVDIRALSAAAGDLRDARDTALEIRSTIASGVVCDTIARPSAARRRRRYVRELYGTDRARRQRVAVHADGFAGRVAAARDHVGRQWATGPVRERRSTARRQRRAQIARRDRARFRVLRRVRAGATASHHEAGALQSVSLI